MLVADAPVVVYQERQWAVTTYLLRLGLKIMPAAGLKIMPCVD